MTAFNLIIFVMLLWALRNLILGFLSWRKSRIWRKIEHKEVTQRFFAEARNDLMGLILREEISPNSVTFRFFYYFDTFVMRRPNDYNQISALLRYSLVSDDNSNSGIIESLIKEKKTWTPSVKQMVSKQSKALNHLMVSHSFVLRNIYKFSLVLIPVMSLVFSTIDLWQKLKDRVGENDKGFVHNVYQSEKTLESLIAI
jgi:hypothetical protein